jgi:superfamily II DNA or RNA helicase
MDSEEKSLYNEQKAIFDNFISKYNIRGFGVSVLQRIIMMSGRNKDARNALKARQRMGKISSNSTNKFIALAKLLREHRNKKVLIFSQSTETVERIGFEFFVPFITYETDTSERKEFVKELVK